MAKTYEITAPDGKTYEVTAPDNATKDQVLAYAKENYKPKSPVDQIPGIKPQAQPQPEPGLMDKVYGAGEAALSAATAIPASIAGNVAGVVRGVTGGNYGTPEGVRNAEDRAQEVSKALTFAPRTDAGRGALEAVGNVIDSTKIAGLGPSEAVALSGVAGPAINQAKSAIVPAAKAVGEEASLIKGATSAAARSVLPLPRSEVVALARKAQALDIPIRPDMLTDNKFARIIGEALEKIPASGSKAEARQIGFNRALIAQIGGDRNAQRLTPDVFKAAMDESGAKIGGIAERTPIRLDPQTEIILQRQAALADKFNTSDISKIVKSYVDELTAKGSDGLIPGKTFKEINSKLGAQIRSTSNGDLRLALSDLQDELQDILAKNVKNPGDIQTLSEAKKQYAIGKTLEPLVSKSTTGDISPPSLMGAVTNSGSKKRAMARGGGEIGDLARIGQLFLKEPASSGTTERALVYGGLLGGGAALNPALAGAVYGAANLYNRAGPSIAKSITGLDPLRQ